MSVPKKIREALEFTGLPVSQMRHDGPEEAYFVFRLDSFPQNFAGNTALHDVTAVQLHLYAPFTMNTRRLRKQVRKAMEEAGFTRPNSLDVSDAARKSDGTEQHIVFECEIEEVVGDG